MQSCHNHCTKACREALDTVLENLSAEPGIADIPKSWSRYLDNACAPRALAAYLEDDVLERTSVPCITDGTGTRIVLTGALARLRGSDGSDITEGSNPVKGSRQSADSNKVG